MMTVFCHTVNGDKGSEGKTSHAYPSTTFTIFLVKGGGSCKDDGGVSRWKRAAVAMVGAPFVDAVFQYIRRSSDGNGGQAFAKESFFQRDAALHTRQSQG